MFEKLIYSFDSSSTSAVDGIVDKRDIHIFVCDSVCFGMNSVKGIDEVRV